MKKRIISTIVVAAMMVTAVFALVGCVEGETEMERWNRSRNYFRDSAAWTAVTHDRPTGAQDSFIFAAHNGTLEVMATLFALDSGASAYAAALRGVATATQQVHYSGRVVLFTTNADAMLFIRNVFNDVTPNPLPAAPPPQTTLASERARFDALMTSLTGANFQVTNANVLISDVPQLNQMRAVRRGHFEAAVSLATSEANAILWYNATHATVLEQDAFRDGWIVVSGEVQHGVEYIIHYVQEILAGGSGESEFAVDMDELYQVFEDEGFTPTVTTTAAGTTLVARIGAQTHFRLVRSSSPSLAAATWNSTTTGISVAVANANDIYGDRENIYVWFGTDQTMSIFEDFMDIDDSFRVLQ